MQNLKITVEKNNFDEFVNPENREIEYLVFRDDMFSKVVLRLKALLRTDFLHHLNS